MTSCRSTTCALASRCAAAAAPADEWLGCSAQDLIKNFEVEYIAVNERLQAEGMDLSTYDLRNIPTIVVTRDGKEVGRFIEKSSEPAEVELEALLTGKKTGVLSTNAKIVEHYGLDKK